jgi:hypothetical protein
MLFQELPMQLCRLVLDLLQKYWAVGLSLGDPAQVKTNSQWKPAKSIILNRSVPAIWGNYTNNFPKMLKTELKTCFWNNYDRKTSGRFNLKRFQNRNATYIYRQYTYSLENIPSLSNSNKRFFPTL